jgi:hypothetical protein
MSERWTSKKQTQALIDYDIGNKDKFPHFKVKRNFSSERGQEDGFLVVGKHTITFLGSDNEKVISSHPLPFLEGYGRDLKKPKGKK